MQYAIGRNIANPVMSQAVIELVPAAALEGSRHAADNDIRLAADRLGLFRCATHGEPIALRQSRCAILE